VTHKLILDLKVLKNFILENILDSRKEGSNYAKTEYFLKDSLTIKDYYENGADFFKKNIYSNKF
jgi:hypothetical protein